MEQRQSVRSLPPEKEGAAETRSDELTTTPIPCTALLRGRRERKFGVELSLARREGWDKSIFNIWFYFSLSYSDLIANKEN